MPFPNLDDLDKGTMYLDAAGGWGGAYSPGQGAGGLSGPFIPTFGGQAPGWAGLPQGGEWGGMGGMGGSAVRRRMARPMMGAGGGPMIGGTGGSQIGGIGNPWGGGGISNPWGGGIGLGNPPGGARPAPSAPWSPAWQPGPEHTLWNPVFTIADLIRNAITGANPGFGGAFGLNPPAAIMEGVRGQAVADAGARERAARLGLQSRGDVDPSTYGFQALQSQLQGQDQTSRAMNQANLGLRQQQLQNYWGLLNAMLREGSATDRAYLGAAQQQQGGGFDWGGLLGGLGGFLAGGPPGAIAGYGAGG